MRPDARWFRPTLAAAMIVLCVSAAFAHGPGGVGLGAAGFGGGFHVSAIGPSHAGGASHIYRHYERAAIVPAFAHTSATAPSAAQRDVVARSFVTHGFTLVGVAGAGSLISNRGLVGSAVYFPGNVLVPNYELWGIAANWPFWWFTGYNTWGRSPYENHVYPMFLAPRFFGPTPAIEDVPTAGSIPKSVLVGMGLGNVRRMSDAEGRAVRGAYYARVDRAPARLDILSLNRLVLHWRLSLKFRHRAGILVPTIAETLAQAKAAHLGGDLEAAEWLYRVVLAVDSNHVEAWFLLGLACSGLGKLDEAIASLTQAIRLDPDHVKAQYHLGSALGQSGNLDEAAACLRRAVSLRPDFAKAHQMLGSVLANQGQLDDAIACCRRAVELSPSDAHAHAILGAVLNNQGALDAAAASFQRALELNPNDSSTHHNLGTVYASQAKPDDAIACCRRAVAIDANDAEAHYKLAVMLLLTGRLTEGWREYEWRWKRDGVVQLPLPQPQWTGGPLAGRTILLHSEQGFGDTLQFVRYAEWVKQLGARVIVECKPPLARLLASCPGVDGVLSRGEPLPQFDLWTTMLNLPGIFATSLETIPARVSYLRPDQPSIEQWKDELSGEPLFKIGIAWQGTPTQSSDRARSFPLVKFAGIAATRGVRLVCLQMGAGREQLADWCGQPIVDFGDRLGDFHNTAAIMRNLDLVITCDSAPAHLAGALGVPVWVALAQVPDWRWMLERNDSPWYPTMRLFRQPTRGDWDSVFEAMRGELAKVV